MKKIIDYGEENNINLKLVIAFLRSELAISRKTLKSVSKRNLTISQFGVLESLYHKGDMRISDIINITLSTSGNMTVVIKNLEKSGLIARYQSPEDKRASIITITDEGSKLISEIFPEHLDELKFSFSRLTKGEKEELLKLMKKMNGV